MVATLDPIAKSNRGSKRWWRRPWVLPLGFLVVAFVAFSLPPYLSLDASQSRIEPPAAHPWYFLTLVAHVTFASIAMLACVLQIWPWFRQRYRRAHRVIGRIYVFAGVLPAGVSAIAIASVSPFGPVGALSTMLMAPLWLTFTLAGFRMARQRRFAEHRKWMIRSFALTMSIITNRIWGVVAVIVLTPQLDTTFQGSQTMLSYSIAGISTWAGWTIPLLVTQWWLERGDVKRRATASRKVVTAQAASGVQHGV